MTARLHIAEGIEPIGQHMGELAALWCDLITGGPSHDDMAWVTFSPEDDGTITVHFGEAEPVIKWAEYLGGLAFTREHIGGRTYRIVAAGHVTRGERSALVRLSCSHIERSIA